MLKPSYKILFHLNNENIEIVEIRRNGIIDEDKNKIYFWLLYDKANDMLSRLDFVSMKSSNQKEYREFSNSKLEINTTTAVYSEGSKIYNMKVEASDIALPPVLKDAIGDFLLLLNFRNERG